MTEFNDLTTAQDAGGIPDRRHAERRDSERRRIMRLSVQSVVALLVAILALLAVVALGVRSVRFERALAEQRERSEAIAADHARLLSTTAALETRTRNAEALLQPLAQLPQQVAAAAAALEALRARVDAPQRTLARVEARHLVDLADQRLRFERDLPSAIALLEAADARLAVTLDPASAPLRTAIAADLGKLRAVPAVDRRGVITALLAAEESAAALPIAGEIKRLYAPVDTRAPDKTGFARFWDQFTGALRDLVSVRRIGKDTVELVSREEAGVRRHHLEVLLYSARLAVLRGEQSEFTASVREARDWLERFFVTRDAPVARLIAELQQLEAVVIAPPLPELKSAALLLRAPT
jgi:uroporphyrin-3 C-methyltransferase